MSLDELKSEWKMAVFGIDSPNLEGDCFSITLNLNIVVPELNIDTWDSEDEMYSYKFKDLDRLQKHLSTGIEKRFIPIIQIQALIDKSGVGLLDAYKKGYILEWCSLGVWGKGLDKGSINKNNGELMVIFDNMLNNSAKENDNVSRPN